MLKLQFFLHTICFNSLLCVCGGGGPTVFVSSSECPVFCAGHRSVIGLFFVISYRDNSGHKTNNYALCWRILNGYDIINSVFVF
jgi:hypothetical protein